MTEEYSAFGTILAMGNGEAASEEFTKMAQVRDIEGPGMSMSTLDATHHQSLNYMKEKVAGLIDGGKVTFEICWDPADATHDFTTGIPAVMKTRAKRNWYLVTPVPAVSGYFGLAFAAFITGWKPKSPVEGLQAADVELDVTGPITEVDVDVDSLC